MDSTIHTTTDKKGRMYSTWLPAYYNNTVCCLKQVLITLHLLNDGHRQCRKPCSTFGSHCRHLATGGTECVCVYKTSESIATFCDTYGLVSLYPVQFECTVNHHTPTELKVVSQVPGASINSQTDIELTVKEHKLWLARSCNSNHIVRWLNKLMLTMYYYHYSLSNRLNRGLSRPSM